MGAATSAPQETATTRAILPDGLVPAPRFHRFTAAMIDIAIVGILVQILGQLGLHGLVQMISSAVVDGLGSNSSPNFFLLMFAGLLSYLILFVITILLVPPIYFVICESSKFQATVGKFLTGVFVGDEGGKRLSPQRAALRYFAKSLWVAPLLLLILAPVLFVGIRSLVSADSDSGAAFPFSLFAILALLAVGATATLWYKTYPRIAFSPDGRGLHDALTNSFVLAREQLPATAKTFGMLIGALVLSSVLYGTVKPEKRKSARQSFTQLDSKTRGPRQPSEQAHHSDRSMATASKPNAVSIPPTEQLNEPANKPVPEAGSSLVSTAEDSFTKVGGTDSVANTAVTTAAVSSAAVATISAPAIAGSTSAVAAITVAAEPTAPSDVIVARPDNLVMFGFIKRYLPYSAAVFDASRTSLRLYLSQAEISTSQRAALAGQEASGPTLPPGIDLALFADFPSRVDTDCSLGQAENVTMMIYRRGLTGFPLPGNAARMSVQLKVEPPINDVLTCSAGGPGAVAVSGSLIGAGVVAQGQAAYPVRWNIAVSAEK